MNEAREKLTRLEELNDEDLLERAWTELSALCGSEGRPKKWTMTIPVDADRDSDILFGEVLGRYAKLKKALTLIGDIGYDYDGYGTPHDLKKLIDEMVGYARNPQSAIDALTEEFTGGTTPTYFSAQEKE